MEEMVVQAGSNIKVSSQVFVVYMQEEEGEWAVFKTGNIPCSFCLVYNSPFFFQIKAHSSEKDKTANSTLIFAIEFL